MIIPSSTSTNPTPDADTTDITHSTDEIVLEVTDKERFTEWTVIEGEYDYTLVRERSGNRTVHRFTTLYYDVTAFYLRFSETGERASEYTVAELDRPISEAFDEWVIENGTRLWKYPGPNSAVMLTPLSPSD